MATVIRPLEEMQRAAERLRMEGKTVAVVPTMGALHQGHCALIHRARTLADAVITTIFVNPTQFAPGEDLSRYPRPFEKDLEMAAGAGTDLIFAPEAEAMYPAGSATTVRVDGLTTVLEGAARPTHFQGVTTVVTKLFHLTRPHIAVLGQKDAQQVAVIRRMVLDLNFAVRIEVVPIVREPDGLAMSSRNVYLTPEQRAEAPLLFVVLQMAERRIREGERLKATLVRQMEEHLKTRTSATIDYISMADPNSLGEQDVLMPGVPVLISLAARFGQTRLIDNILVVP